MKKITEELFRIVDEINKTAVFGLQKKIKIDPDVKKLFPPGHRIFFDTVGGIKQERASFFIPLPGWPTGHTWDISIVKDSEETSGDIKELGEYRIFLNKDHEGTAIPKKDAIKFLQCVKKGEGVDFLMTILRGMRDKFKK